MGRWKNLLAWLSWYMQLIQILVFILFLSSCTISSTQQIITEKEKKNKSKVTISSGINTELKVNN